MGRTKNTLIMSSLKIMLMSTGILTIAILLTFSMPNLLAFATSHVPSLFATLRTWLRPPYLYFIINAIIIAIVFLHNHHHNHHHAPPHKVAVAAAAVVVPPQSHHHYLHHDTGTSTQDVISVHADHFPASYDLVSSVVAHNSNVTTNEEDEREKIKRVVFVDDDDQRGVKSTVVERSTTRSPPRSPAPLLRQGALKKEGFSSEKPPAAARFGHHRRPAKPTPAEGGKALKVSKPKKHDTLESTWKAITEGRHVPLNRHLKKSDTWENHVRQIDVLEDPCPFPPKVKKSETFKERTNHTTPPPVTTNKLKKEPSIGQDDLNRRVEAFINKFNEDMRLQRQESMQQFMEMINRAA